MHKFRSLKLLDNFQGFFRSIQIDYTTMRRILEIKLLMDQRRVPAVLNADISNKRKEGNQFVKSLGIYALYSLTLIPVLFFGDNLMYQSSILFGIMMFILMTSMISDFSAVLLDVRDKTILNTKPVHNRTINAAKLIHIMIYMTLLAGAFIAVPSIVMLATGRFSFFSLFLMETVLMLLFMIALTALAYIFILHYFSGDRLKDIINYVQIILAIGIVVGYQIVIRAFDFAMFEFVYDFSWWHILIPPLWFGAPFELLLNGNSSGPIIFMALLALVIPFIAIGIYYYLMPSFESNLEKLLENTGNPSVKKHPFERFWERMLCKGKQERLFFRFSLSMMRQERDFKLKVYPTIGMALVFPFIFMFNSLNRGSFEELAAGNAYFNIYFSCIMIGTVIHILKYSVDYKGSWIFQAAPIEGSAVIYGATLKAFLVKLYFPVFIMLSAVFIVIFSFRIVPDLAVVFVTAILHTLISYKLINNESYPFTNPMESVQMQGGSTVKYLILMVLVGITALLHFLASKVEYGVYGYLLILIAVTIISWKFCFSGSKVF
ncbi:hypothetical protein GCM10009001_32780 [Virgibacillus siamensis]|uniref:ABC transporter permease n=2 Tax=Virgibacillus siamensis TaxID=480071 RepID=A0ABN1GJS6_9BACI